MKRDGELLHVDWNAVKKTVTDSQEYVIKNPALSCLKSKKKMS